MGLHLEIGLLQRCLNYSEAIRVGPKSNLIGVLIRGNMVTQKGHWRYMHTEEIPHEEDSARRWPNAAKERGLSRNQPC